MAREINRLSARKVQALSEPGRHADGGGLYLVIEPSGSKRWVMLYRMPGRRREMGLGSASAVSLARARELATAARAQIAEGIDPIEARAAAIAPLPLPTHRPRHVRRSGQDLHGRSGTDLAERGASRAMAPDMEVQAASLWRMPVADIGTDDVLAVLRPMWHEKAETARRIRGASSACWTRPGSAVTGPARIRPAGAATSTCCCPDRAS